jgi:hypothetical protein
MYYDGFVISPIQRSRDAVSVTKLSREVRDIFERLRLHWLDI